jgi:SynChlorMet cassette radical SAM/SPASM protein ScmE
MNVMRTPRCIDIAITNKCNLRCKYCYHFNSAGDVDTDLSLNEWLDFFDELQQCTVLEVVLSGGEPFFRNDIKEIIKGIVIDKMRFSILTNGTLINEEIAEFIASTGRCNRIQISIDSLKAETHDCFRGAGTFVKAVNGLKILKKYALPVAVRVTIHRENYRDLEAAAEFLLEELELPSFSTNSTYYMGLCREFSHKVQLTPDERVETMETLLRLEKKYNGRVNATAGPLFDAKSWLQMENRRKQSHATKNSSSKGGYLSGCNGVRRKLAVRSDGTIIPCSQLSHVELGRVNADSLKEIWQHHNELVRLREAAQIPLEEFQYCKGCQYIKYCIGSCPGVSYVTTGTEEHPYPESCLRRFLEQGGRLPNYE